MRLGSAGLGGAWLGTARRGVNEARFKARPGKAGLVMSEARFEVWRGLAGPVSARHERGED